jgi:predicted phosphodiesterase
LAYHPPRTDLDGSNDFRADLLDPNLSRDAIAEKWNASAGFVSSRRQKARDEEYVKGAAEAAKNGGLAPGESDDIKTRADGTHMEFVRNRPVTLADARELIRATGDDPDDYHLAIRAIGYGGPGDAKSSNKISVWPKVGGKDGEPSWPVIQPARDPITIKPLRPTPRASRFKTAVLAGDPQMGFDMDGQGNLVPYHDDRAIDIFNQVVALEQPEQTVILGDIIDLAEQGRWAQEARFAHTTQPALERARVFAADTRARTTGEIHWIEGNHDKRMQAFMEANAKASMGLKKAGYPDSWPVMSIPNLVGLDEFDVRYVDAYPAGVHWITEGLRAIHGTKANSKGSTAAQYANEMPHISTAFGHTHRLEIQSKTTSDRAGKIRTMNINPGCLCRVDGAVPSVHGARHLDGSKATYWEDWQQGVAVIRYLDDGKFYVELVQIDEGVGMHGGQELVAAV